jgi:hypothetical protein
MKNFQDFYTLFDITPNSDEKQIKLGYLNKISKFNNIKKISNENIKEIKLLKTGLYILTNMELKNIYDKRIMKISDSEKNKEFSDNTRIDNEPAKNQRFLSATLSEKNKEFSDNEPATFESYDSKSGMLLINSGKTRIDNDPLPENHENNDTFDTVFKVDNSWMNQVNVNSETNNGRKNKGENNTISNRIFSLSEFNKKPNFSSDVDSELRRPLQGREDKSKLDQ